MYVESKKTLEVNLFVTRKWSQRCRKKTYGYQRRKERGGINQKIEIDRYTLLYVKYLIKIYRIAQGAFLGTLYCPIWGRHPNERIYVCV